MKKKTSKRKSVFGPSKDEIWEQIATGIGGEFIQGASGARTFSFTNTVSGKSCLIPTSSQRERRHTRSLGCVRHLSIRMASISRFLAKDFSAESVNSSVCRT